jgi:hypothetical protein
VTGLWVGMLAGAVGMGYFIYGKRQAKYVPMIAGILLCVYPYFLENPWALGAVGLLLIAAPFLIDY